MQVIIGARGAGKTTECVKLWRKEPNAVLIVPTAEQRRWIIETFGILGRDKDRIMHFHEFKERMRGKLLSQFPPAVIIDNADQIIAGLIGPVSINALSFTGNTTMLHGGQ